MSVLKGNLLREKYSTIPNDIVVSNISHGALRVYVYIASKPEGWLVRNRDIKKQLSISQDHTLAKYLKELVDSGWIFRERSKDEDGKLSGGYDYHIMDKPHCGKYHIVENTQYGKNHSLSNTDNCSNTDLSIKKETNTINFDVLLTFINDKTGRSFRLINNQVKKKFKARLKEGYSKEDIKSAIINASASNYHKETGGQYLTPEFFSRASTLDKYGSKTTKGNNSSNSQTSGFSIDKLT